MEEEAAKEPSAESKTQKPHLSADTLISTCYVNSGHVSHTASRTRAKSRACKSTRESACTFASLKIKERSSRVFFCLSIQINRSSSDMSLGYNFNRNPKYSNSENTGANIIPIQQTARRRARSSPPKSLSSSDNAGTPSVLRSNSPPCPYLLPFFHFIASFFCRPADYKQCKLSKRTKTYNLCTLPRASTSSTMRPRRLSLKGFERCSSIHSVSSKRRSAERSSSVLILSRGSSRCIG